MFKLNVYMPTTVQGNPLVTKNEGGEVTLECVASYDKDAQVEFTWQFNNFDLTNNPKYQIHTTRSPRSRSNGEIEMVSKLHIRQVTKEHDGKYTCMVDTTNTYISDSKELPITLRVHCKFVNCSKLFDSLLMTKLSLDAPRFDANTPKHIWISEDNVNQGGPHTVNISCIVAADPSAKIRWLNINHQEIEPSRSMCSLLNSYLQMTNVCYRRRSLPRQPKHARAGVREHVHADAQLQSRRGCQEASAAGPPALHVHGRKSARAHSELVRAQGRPPARLARDHAHGVQGW